MSQSAPTPSSLGDRLGGTAFVLVAVGIVGGLIWAVRSIPSSEDRFAACMAIADRAGLVANRRDEVGLICLQNATRRRGDDGNGVPIVIPSTNGGPSIVIQ